MELVRISLQVLFRIVGAIHIFQEKIFVKDKYGHHETEQ